MSDAPAATALRLEPLRTVLAGGDMDDWVLAVGARELADTVFRHEPPMPHELEQAIDRVEDALSAAGLRQAARGDLWTDDARLVALPGLQAPGARLRRSDIEAPFQRLASTSLGHPGLLDGLRVDRDAAAALLILRECMHHLGYDGIRHAAPPALPMA